MSQDDAWMSLPKDIEREVQEHFENSEDPEGPGLDTLCEKFPEHADEIRRAVGRAARVFDGMADPESIGPYEILGKLGEGGMGVVYRARQTSPIEREVALKVIRLGMDTKRILARFEFERQALARLDHPGIARILDAGVTERGSPYFTMDLVEGIPITRFCDSGELDPHNRLRLFESVCRAVQHAHQKGIIHRDLKPSNILVGLSEGNPAAKIIDFGLARAIQRDPHSASLRTRAGAALGTPEYMSPEQADVSERNADIDTRADVYSLGILLHELLTGKRPESRDGGHKIAMGGELAWIIGKAIDSDRERRYSGASALADDVSRFLRSEAIEAAPPSLSYRMRKLAGRYRIQVGAALAILASLSIGLVTSYSMYMAAERDKLTAQKSQDFLIDLFRHASPQKSLGAEIPVRLILDQASRRIEEDLKGQPRVQARLLATCGLVYLNLGEYEKAGELLDLAIGHMEALGLEQQRDCLAWRVDRENARVGTSNLRSSKAALERLRQDLSSSLGHTDPLTLLVRRQIAFIEQRSGKVEESLATLKEILRTALKSAAPLVIASCRADLATALYRARAYEDATREFQQAIRSFEEEGKAGDPRLAVLRSGQMRSLLAQGKVQAADTASRALLSESKRLLGEEHPRYAFALRERAHFLGRTGRTSEASTLLKLAVQILEVLPNSDQMAWTLNDLGANLLRSGNARDAVEPLSRSARIYKSLDAVRDVHAAITSTNLALALLRTGNPDKGKPHLERAMTDLAEIEPKGGIQTSLAYRIESEFLERAGKPEEALARLEEATAMARRFGSKSLETAITAQALSFLRLRLGRFADSLASTKIALREFRAAGITKGESYALSLYHRGWARAGNAKELPQKDRALAIQDLRDSLRVFEESYGDELPANSAFVSSHLGDLLSRGSAEEKDEAIGFFELTLRTWQRCLPEGSYRRLASISKLGSAYATRGQYGKAASLLQKAIEGFRKLRGERSREVQSLTELLERIRKRQKDSEKQPGK